MPSGATETAEPALLLLQQRLQGLGLRQREPPGKDEEHGGGEAELREDEDDEDDDETDAAALLFPSPLFAPHEAALGARGMMAAMLSHPYGEGPAPGGEQAALNRRKSVNTTECVPVPSSEHVAEIVGRQGCKIKALRARTHTSIRTPLRGEEPAFVVTGRRGDVAAARTEILRAAERFSLLRAAAAAAVGQSAARVRVPQRAVGLAAGPRGAAVKRVQRQTRTRIATPGRRGEPVFQGTGAPRDVRRARREMELLVALRTGAFHTGGAGTGPEEGGTAWAEPRTGQRHGSSGSPGSGSTDSCRGSGSTDSCQGSGSTDSCRGSGSTDSCLGSGSTDSCLGSGSTDSCPGSGSTDSCPAWTDPRAGHRHGSTDSCPGSGSTDSCPAWTDPHTGHRHGSTDSCPGSGSTDFSPAWPDPRTGHRHGSSGSPGSGSTDSCLGSGSTDSSSAWTDLHTGQRHGSSGSPGSGSTDSCRGSGSTDSCPAWPDPRTGQRRDSSGSPGSGSTDSCLGSGSTDFSPASPFGAAAFWFGEAPPDSSEPLPAPSPKVWEPAGGARAPLRGSRPPTPRLSPTCPESPELARRAWTDPPGSGRPPALPVPVPAFSTGTGSRSSSAGGSASSSPPESRRGLGCALCPEGEAGAAALPCGHCPACRAAVTRAVHTRS